MDLPHTMSRTAHSAQSGESVAEAGWLELVRQQVGSLRYGVVQIIVHDGHVTQIEKTERLRLETLGRTATRVGRPEANALSPDSGITA
jgi:hypothetical protein